MSSQQSVEEMPVFEEEEVLWAKIKGYPWWPAFVNIVHDTNEDQQASYTVFFFGDNTHSRLGASKLRKFIPNYHDCYQKAKTHRKLMMSIMKAEENLKENGENVEIFQTIRNQLKSKRGRGANKTESKVSSEDHANNLLSETPDLSNSLFKTEKFKSHGHNRDHKIKSEEKIDDEKEEVKSNGKRLRSDSKKNEWNEKSSQKEEKQEKKYQSLEKARATRRLSKKEEIFQEKSSSSDKDRSKNQQKSPLRLRRRIERSKQISSSSEKEDNSEERLSEERRKEAKKSALKKNVEVRGVVRKRGRPKKIIVEEPEEEVSEIEEKRPANVKVYKKKIIQKQKINYQDETKDIRPRKKEINDKLPEKNQKYSKKLTQNDAQIIERVKFCLTNRDELIEYLSTIQITTDNVKEILDLDVTTILQEQGECTNYVIELLELLKATLLYKYFPDDIQIKKKYDKIMKKKQSAMKNNDQSGEEIEYHGQELTIRRKTVLKLEKFLRKDPHFELNAKDVAVKIESYFRKADQGIGNTYKTLAYKVLRTLKDQKESFKDVLLKLENKEYENELEID